MVNNLSYLFLCLKLSTSKSSCAISSWYQVLVPFSGYLTSYPGSGKTTSSIEKVLTVSGVTVTGGIFSLEASPRNKRGFHRNR